MHFSEGFGSDAGDSLADSLGRPDSLGPVDDDEDKIPEELLLKYVVCMWKNFKLENSNLILIYDSIELTQSSYVLYIRQNPILQNIIMFHRDNSVEG